MAQKKLVVGADGWPAPPPPAKLPTLETIQKAKVRLSQLTASWNGGVCMGEMWTCDGDLINVGHTACHSWVGYAFTKHAKSKSGDYGWAPAGGYAKGAANMLTLTCHNPEHKTCTKEANDEFILWMASDESPFGKYILNRDDKDSLTNSGAIIYSGPDGATQAETMWICKALRYCVEGQQSLDTWLALYKGGIHPLLAFLVCNFISSANGGVFNSTVVNGHCAVIRNGYNMGAPVDVDSFMNFQVNREAAETGSIFRSKTAKEQHVTTKISAFCKPFVKDDGWGGKITGNGVGAQDLVAKVLEWQKELGGYIPGARFSGQSLQIVAAEAVAEMPPPLPKGDTVYLDFDM